MKLISREVRECIAVKSKAAFLGQDSCLGGQHSEEDKVFGNQEVVHAA